MIFGAHVIVYSKDPTADRVFFRDVLGLSSVDAGHDWLIFALPPSELAVHPGETNGAHELYLTCEDIEKFVKDVEARGVECSPLESLGWGRRTRVRIPGGGQLGVYEPRHARPAPEPSR